MDHRRMNFQNWREQGDQDLEESGEHFGFEYFELVSWVPGQKRLLTGYFALMV